MKVVRFLSQFTLLCNLCFITFAVFNHLEIAGPKGASPDALGKIPFIKETIIILGISAIVINFLMCCSYLILLIAGRKSFIPKWLAPVNVAFLLLEVYYFFISTF